MGAFTNTTSDYMLDWLVGKATPPAVSTRYITTFNGDPAGAGSENINTLTGSANRINLTTAFGSSAAASSTANTALITFFTAASGTGTVDYLAVYDSLTGGNMMASCGITAKLMGLGDGLAINIGQCTFSIS